MRGISACVSACSKMTSGACIVLAFGLFALLNVQVAGRYIFHWSPVWAAEGAQILFVWLCFLGFAVAAARGEHVSLGYLLSALPQRVRMAADQLSGVATIATGCVVAWGGFVLVERLASAKTSGIGLSVAWLYAAPLTGGALIAVFEAHRMLVRVLRNGEVEE